MRHPKKILVALLLVAFCATAESNQKYKFEFVDVSDVVKNIKKKFSSIECYSAQFKILTEKMGKKSYQRGTIKTMNPNRILIDFSNPPGQKIVSNGKLLWVYIPSLNVVAEQDLDSESGSIFSSGTKSGLRRLFSKYHFKFASKNQPEEATDGKKYYTLLLKQRESRSGFRTFKLWVNEDFLITKAIGKTSTGKTVEIEFSHIQTDKSYPKGIFKFDIPSRARVIKNPMVSEE